MTVDSINVVFSSDQNFLPYFATSLCSLLVNYADSRELHAYLLTDQDFSAADQASIERMRKIRPFELHPILMDADRYRSIKTTAGISVAAYNRLHMDEELPSEVDRVLYLDSDLIVERNIGEIFDMPMEDLLFRGVEDSISSTYKKRYGLPSGSLHINSGVMLCNVQMMRGLGFGQQIENFLSANRYRITMGDQQIINELFHARIGALPLAWNVHGSMFDSAWANNNLGVNNSMDVEEFRSAILSPAVVHYTYKRKPWETLDHPLAQRWHIYNKMTPFERPLPAQKQATVAVERPVEPPPKSTPLKRLFGYLTSVERLRLTRLEVHRQARTIEWLRKRKPPLDTRVDDSARDALLSNILQQLGSRTGPEFIARKFVEGLKEQSKVLCNARGRDLHGGFNENIKTILRTPNIAQDTASECDFAMILVHRVRLPEFWDCVNTAYFYNIPLIFAEMNLFSAFSAYFDETAEAQERKCVGFILDDMGSYFDARQPSRIERTLNDPAFTTTEAEKARASRLISRIVDGRFTKYNKYVPHVRQILDIESNAVVVIDQKRGDASIEFARAHNASFERMLSAAIDENPGRTIYVKSHPDNIHRDAAAQVAFNHARVSLIPDDVSAPDLLDAAGSVYVVSSQMGFEALLRGRRVVTFGLPFYSGWGLTDDRCHLSRRVVRRSIEDVFHVICLRQSVYLDPKTGQLIEMEDMLDVIEDMRRRFVHPTKQ